jgi:hypothetical protein
MRQIDQNNVGTNQRFGGIITVGSPNNGAFIANALLDGTVDEAVADACARMGAGPISQFGDASALRIGGSIIAISLCNDFREIVDNFFADNSLTVEEISADSDFINFLNTAGGNVPVINIWGNEQSPVHWRLWSSILSNNNNDQTLVTVAALVKSAYITFVAINSAGAVLGGILGIFNPTLFIAAAVAAARVVAWSRGLQWLNNSETLWKTLIGSIRTDIITEIRIITTAQCEFGINQWEEQIDLDNLGDPETEALLWAYDEWLAENYENCFQEIEEQRTVYVNEPSDGLIPESSQVMQGIPQNNIYEALGVNHSEETNTSAGTTLNGNDEMQDVFNLIWDRDPQSDFFRTPERQ